MKRRAIVLSCTLALAVTELAFGEIVQIPLPGLIGPYEEVRSTSFQLPDEPIVVRGASIRLIGEVTVGAVGCEWGGPYAWPMEFTARFLGTEPEGTWYVWGLTPEESGSFEITGDFYAIQGDPTWEFLLDGEGELTLFGSRLPLVDLCWEITIPTATVTDAFLIVDADFPVPIDNSTWGRIKALFD